MLRFEPTNQFNKDIKAVARQGLDLNELQQVIDAISAGERLPDRMRDHALSGDYRGHRECHIRPDWLLVYRTTATSLIAVRTGSHSELRLA